MKKLRIILFNVFWGMGIFSAIAILVCFLSFIVLLAIKTEYAGYALNVVALFSILFIVSMGLFSLLRKSFDKEKMKKELDNANIEFNSKTIRKVFAINEKKVIQKVEIPSFYAQRLPDGRVFCHYILEGAISYSNIEEFLKDFKFSDD